MRSKITLATTLFAFGSTVFSGCSVGASMSTQAPTEEKAQSSSAGVRFGVPKRFARFEAPATEESPLAVLGDDPEEEARDMYARTDTAGKDDSRHDT